ncbi:hypothetical protein LOK49_LG12G02306 [Camellia lanceoleosa]|uniref:Uncharacterized protein n=1 Tax=Camellia lanceoleosa TaxID=1840588 RepID=A0ACC0FTA4_9ERIC|nr:hypothetical protein LOK49_LG12G02306 [Camellia lanceoleosa]
MLSHSFSLCSSSSLGSLSDSNTLLISHPLHISLTLANGAETESMTTITRSISSGSHLDILLASPKTTVDGCLIPSLLPSMLPFQM